MIKYNIAKEFNFDYGHRVWPQKLNSEFSLDCELACRHLHGHRGTVIVHLESEELDNQGMVTDFHHLNWFKKFLDDAIDHKFILDRNDPLLLDLFPLLVLEEMKEYAVANLNDVPVLLWEIYEGLVIVDFIPTSENMAKWLLDIVSHKMKPLSVLVSHIEFFETPKSQSVCYQGTM